MNFNIKKIFDLRLSHNASLIPIKLVEHWLAYRMGLQLPKDFKATCILPLGGPAVSEPLLIFNAKKMVAIDEGKFIVNNNYRGEDSLTRSSGLWLESTIDQFGILPLLRFELKEIGASDIRVELSCNRVTVNFNWKHPEKENAENREYVIYNERLPSQSENVIKFAELCNVGILKGYMLQNVDEILNCLSPHLREPGIFLVSPDLAGDFPKSVKPIIDKLNQDPKISVDQELQVIGR